jgi:hypothetical protein
MPHQLLDFIDRGSVLDQPTRERMPETMEMIANGKSKPMDVLAKFPAQIQIPYSSPLYCEHIVFRRLVVKPL